MSGEIVVIHFESVNSGKSAIDSKKFKILDSKMQEVKVEFLGAT